MEAGGGGGKGRNVPQRMLPPRMLPHRTAAARFKRGARYPFSPPPFPGTGAPFALEAASRAFGGMQILVSNRIHYLSAKWDTPVLEFCEMLRHPFERKLDAEGALGRLSEMYIYGARRRSNAPGDHRSHCL